MTNDYRKMFTDSAGEIRLEKTVRKFSDLDFDFIPHPVSGDINTLTDANSVKRSIRNLMLTGTYERPFRPNLGGNLKQLLFEPVSPLTQISIQVLISDIIRIYEPRVEILDLQVSVNPDETGYNVHLVFAVNETSDVSSVDIFLERLR
jgi:phage baseplate assembly protein W